MLQEYGKIVMYECLNSIPISMAFLHEPVKLLFRSITANKDNFKVPGLVVELLEPRSEITTRRAPMPREVQADQLNKCLKNGIFLNF